MTARSLFKHWIAGLVMLGVLLQACLVALQLAMLAAPATADFAFTVICTGHGSVTVDATHTPNKPGPGCANCPLCAHSGVAAPTAPLAPVSVVVFAIAPAWITVIASDDRSSLALGLPPPGRGPPV